MLPLIRSSGIADPVWLNTPGAMPDDTQPNAEPIAYPIKYISCLTSSSSYSSENNKQKKVKVALMGWSQGNLVAHWALKYFPSNRAVVSDLVAISPDYHGTVNAYFLCPGFPHTPCCPSIDIKTTDVPSSTR